MADDVREVLRAAQSAELQGDKAQAVTLLQRAALLYERAGRVARAVHMLRHALRLDAERADVAQALRRLEAPPQASSLLQSLPLSEGEEERGEEGQSEPSEAAADEDSEHSVWVIEEESLKPLSVEQLLRQAEQAVSARARRLMERRRGRFPVYRPPGYTPTFTVRPLSEAQGAREGAEPQRSEPAPVSEPAQGGEPGKAVAAPEQRPQEEGRERELRFIERGPTLADPALEAWCSFCCRPSTEMGPLVAGPAGSFICATCVGESSSLLGGVAPRAPAARSRPRAPLELVGQAAARTLLAQGLQAGMRRVLVVGPEGCGKSTWLQALVEEGRGVLVRVGAWEATPAGPLLLVEDVDRLPAQEQAALEAYLVLNPTRTVLMTARGTALRPGRVLRADSARLPLATTEALSEAVRGALPVALLEQVQLLVALERPSAQELEEVARRRLALRGEVGQLPRGLLAALAAEAARSPRAGHELQALLARVPAGAWSLEGEEKDTP